VEADDLGVIFWLGGFGGGVVTEDGLQYVEGMEVSIEEVHYV